MNNFYGGRRGFSFKIVKRYSSVAEMEEDFAKASCEVGDGEYVFIETEDKNDSSCGDLYIREGGNPKFISNLRGPAGPGSSLTASDYNTIKQKPNHTEAEYTVLNGGIVSGETNNSIKYDMYNVYENKIYKGTQVGLQIPYPYLKINVTTSGDQAEIVKKDNDNPFYNEWDLNLPSEKRDAIMSRQDPQEDLKVGGLWFPIVETGF